MTTTIESAHCGSSRRVEITDSSLPGRTTVSFADSSTSTLVPVDVSTAEFLAAVAAELGVIIINRDDLPELAEWEKELATAGTGDAVYIRQQAYAQLALAEYLDAHPPVDEAQVDALAALLDDVEPDNGWHTGLARALVARGVTVKEA